MLQMSQATFGKMYQKDDDILQTNEKILALNKAKPLLNEEVKLESKTEAEYERCNTELSLEKVHNLNPESIEEIGLTLSPPSAHKHYS